MWNRKSDKILLREVNAYVCLKEPTFVLHSWQGLCYCLYCENTQRCFCHLFKATKKDARFMALFRSWKILYFLQGFIYKRKFIVIIHMRFVGYIQKLNVKSTFFANYFRKSSNIMKFWQTKFESMKAKSISTSWKCREMCLASIIWVFHWQHPKVMKI